MVARYVLDAHTLIWYIEGNPRLGVNAGIILDDPASSLYLPIIALAEACHIVGRGRTAVPSIAALLADVDADPRIAIVSLDRAILDLSLTLIAITEMHDRLIAATTLYLASPGETATLLTRDSNITISGLVPTLW